MAYRVLYLDHAAEMGGAEHSLAELVHALKVRGAVSPIVATAQQGDFARYLEHLDIDVLPLKLSREARFFPREKAGNLLAMIGQYFYWRPVIKQLRHWVRQHPIDLIHSNTLKMHGLSGFLGKTAKVPVVWHVRDITSHRGNATRVLKTVTRYYPPTGIITISQAVQNSLNGICGTQVTQTIYNGLDMSLLEQIPPKGKHILRQEMGLPQDLKLIVCVGYFIAWKGQDTLIAAFARLHQTHPDTRLVLIGRPIFQHEDEERRLRTLAETLGVADKVIFMGEQQSVVTKLPAFDVFVCPSTQEPFGRVILEAMAARIPIVATQAGGIPEIVRHEQEALLVPPSQPLALVDAVTRVLMESNAARQRTEAAYQRLKKCFTLENTVQQVLNAYQTILPAV